MDCVKEIGCYSSCGALTFPYEALESGVHTLYFEWLGVKKTVTFEAVIGEVMTIPNLFNESSDPVFSIKQPSGMYLCWDVVAEILASCEDHCYNDCDYLTSFQASITDTGGTHSDYLPEPGISDQVFNIESSQVIDNGNGTYTISVTGAQDGALAFDELGNVYEYQGGVWILKLNETCSIQSYPTFAELPDEPESCVLYIDESTKKQYIESGGAYLEVGSSENIYNTNGALAGHRTVDLFSRNLLFKSTTSGGIFRIELRPSSGLDFTTITYISSGVYILSRDGGIDRGVNISGSGVQLFTGQVLSTAYSNGQRFLKLQATNGRVEYSQILSDDIDDSSSVQKFVTQGEKDAIGRNLFTEDLVLEANRNHDIGTHGLDFIGTDGSISFDIEKGVFRMFNKYESDQVSSSIIYDTGMGFKTAGFVVSSNNNDDGVELQLHTGQTIEDIDHVAKRIFLKQSSNLSITEWGRIEIPEYASDVEADADATLHSGEPYSITGNRAVFRKP